MKHTQLWRLWSLTILLIVLGCSSARPGRSATPTTTSAGASSPNTSVTAAPSTTTPSASTTTATPGGPLPKGFEVIDLIWVSDTQGWALGTAPCSHPPCTSVAHTVDGGRTWAGLPAPVAYPPNQTDQAVPPLVCSTTLACVAGIRFADANTGYAFGESSLWLTTNGGRTWVLRSRDPTDALEVAHGTVIRVSRPIIGCEPGCTYRVQTAPVGSTSWHTLPVPLLTAYGAALAIEGSNIYLGAFGHVAGGAGDAHTMFVRSTDRGQHWVRFSDPCGTTPAGSEADASAISAAAGNYLAVACTPRATGEAGFITLSADAGATFGPHRGNLLAAVPADGEEVPRISAATGRQIAVVVTSGAGFNISVTNDGGSDWTTTRTEASTNFGALDLGFQDATTGRAVLGNPRVLFTTTDGGGHWTQFTFP